MSSETQQQPALSVGYFRDTLHSETRNLTQLCEKWSQVLEDAPAPKEQSNQLSNGASLNNNSAHDEQQCTDNDRDQEELLGAIRSTIGQAKLLMSQRFKQFNELIDHCENNTGQHPTRLNDLSGFWEMISFQVDDVVKKFKLLELAQVQKK